MSSTDPGIQYLLSLKDKSRFEKMTRTAALLTGKLEEADVLPIVVGGLAVEIYTRGQYTTLDIDLVTQRRDLAGEILRDLGFSKEGRHWYHSELEVAIEIPASKLEDADPEKVTRLELPDGLHINVIGIEDIIMDRLRTCVHWKSFSDCEWGLRMLKTHSELVDLPYLRKMAADDCEDSLQLMLEWIAEL